MISITGITTHIELNLKNFKKKRSHPEPQTYRLPQESITQFALADDGQLNVHDYISKVQDTCYIFYGLYYLGSNKSLPKSIGCMRNKNMTVAIRNSEIIPKRRWPF